LSQPDSTQVQAIQLRIDYMKEEEKMTNDQIRDIASDIQSWLQDAVGDIAEGQTMLGKEIAADDAYENEDILSDLSGDRIFDSCKMNYVDMIAVATEIRDSRYSHKPLKNVMDRFIVGWEESLRKAAERDAKRKQREAEAAAYGDSQIRLMAGDKEFGK